MLPKIVSLALSAILIENIILVKFLGVCPFLGVSKKVGTALGMGFAVIFVTAISSALTALVRTYILVPLSLEYMQTITFILIIASLVQFVEMFFQKISPALYASLGIYLPLITTNCAVLGVTLINVQSGYSVLLSTLNGVFIAAGFTLAIVLLAGVREKLEDSDIPKSLQGFPITLISAGLIAIAFMGFSGLSL